MPAAATDKAKISEAYANLKLARKIDDEVLIAFWTTEMDELLDRMIKPKPRPRRPRKAQAAQ